MRMARDCVRWVDSILAFTWLLLTLGSSVAAETQPTESIRSLLIQKCIACHSGDEPQGGLDLTTREHLLMGGESGSAFDESQPLSSLIWQRVEQGDMPPKHPLTDEEKQTVRLWLEGGATWSGGALDPLAVTTPHRAGFDWWSLRPLRQVTIPSNSMTEICTQPIDDFVLDELARHQLSMSAAADASTLIRRISYDLLGLPPLPQEVAEFAADSRPDAIERLIDRLLASPHYGERWARHWLDVVRFGESNGFERDLPRPNAWHYRDWVISALNRDMAYDDFVRWQLAGDVLGQDEAESIKAMGFLVAGAHDTVIPVVDTMRATMRQDELEDLVGTVTQTFLGLTVNCARCHDHKFDPITAREYYQIASSLAGINHGDREYIPPEVVRQLAAWQTEIEQLTRQLKEEETPLRELILSARSAPEKRSSVTHREPKPFAAWDFTRDLRDQAGNLQLTLVGSAERTPNGLILDGKSFARSSPLPIALAEKTLEVRVQLKTLHQSGGGAISLQTLDGQTFDAIVYAENEAARWMAGSEGFQRTLSYQGAAEERAEQEAIVFTQVYHADGIITGYRNGQPYGISIRKSAAMAFEAGQSQILLGLRHGTEAGGNRILTGTILTAKLFDKALTPDEVAASADVTNTYVSEDEILSRLTPERQTSRIATKERLNRLKQSHAELAKNGPQTVYTAILTQPPAMRVHKRGSVLALGEEVEPAGLMAIKGLDPSFELRPDSIESHRRSKLAEWITDARNPLFARVMANRVWHYHFGQGLVESPNDFGFHAGMPSHPDLLEWLAQEFRNGGARSAAPNEATGTNGMSASRFSLKRLHRLMLSSTTCRQSSAFNSEAARQDASNRFLWRMNPRRLEAEAVRDTMLSVSGSLNTELGGKGYSDVNSYFFKGTQFYDPIDPVGHSSHRRTLYRMGARGGRSPFLDNFDCPDPSTTTPRRSSTVTPLQALSLLNHSFSLRMADQFAERLRQISNQPDSQAKAAFELLYCRIADEQEIELSRAFIADQGLSEFCRALWNSSEFLFVD
ncbi:DUF1549 domain-containing protein [Schlesneria sp. T3-172]|uniref:DUF1549 domain-containing protein n=1 Tax=Schlesneria sphaerica TaxID=3373610 RepID=UPI0037CC9A05